MSKKKRKKLNGKLFVKLQEDLEDFRLIFYRKKKKSQIITEKF